MASPEEKTSEILQLAGAVCDGLASDQQIQRLNSLLREDAEAREVYLKMMDLHFDLDRQVARGDLSARETPQEVLVELQQMEQEHSESVSTRRTGRRRNVRGFLLAAAAVVIVVGVSWYNSRPIASFGEIRGNVEVVAASGKTRLASSSDGIRLGETIRVTGGQSSALLVYPDGTRLVLVGKTEIQCSGKTQKHVELRQGTLAASVAPQDKDHPLILATPNSEIEVLGTTFTLTASKQRSNLRVAEGAVRLTRIADEKSVEVTEGKQVDADKETELELQEIPVPPDSWSVSFEDGVPQDWIGNFIDSKLPDGFRGAISTVFDPQGYDPKIHDYKWRQKNVDRIIVSPRDDANGLFAIREDTHLHFTYHVPYPRPAYVYLVCLSLANDSCSLRKYRLLDQAERGAKHWWQVENGQWHTATIPLSRFCDITDADKNPSEDELPLWIEFNCGTHRRLDVSRIWVTPDGPGAIEIDKE